MSDAEIKKKVNEYFRDEVIKPLFQSLTAELGGAANNEQVKKLFDALPVISFFIKIATAGGNGPSESQVMLKVILTAIDNAKNDIINAVDQAYQSDTEAKLQTIIHQLNIYNLYSLETQKTSYVTMLDLSYAASEIKKRLQQKPEKTIENAHLYLLVSSLHMEIERQKIAILNYVSFPGYSEDFIKQRSTEEFLRVANYMVDDGLTYINNAYVGSLEAWKTEYKNSITSNVTWVRDETSSTKIFSFAMNSKPVEFLVKKGLPLRYTCPYTIFDPLGNKYFTTEGSCGLSNSQLAELVKNNIGGILELFKKDVVSFDKYMSDGYEPIKKAFDGWWIAAGKIGFRPQSSVDMYVSNIPNNPKPSICTVSGNSGRVLARPLTIHDRLPSYGSCYPCSYNRIRDGNYTIHQCGVE
ncbi:MAG: hypothetical protein B0W54_10500 [Cellvibrio sp. 79]|nr:MAG: hypothetical protein B0W54_10500 [Cellvibrio sp. 79]